MLTVDRHGLPSALAERLTDEARASFAETPREGRFKFLAQALGLEGAVATTSELVNGRYTGRLVGEFCYGPGKVEAMEKLAAEYGYDLAASYAYSDSVTDLPMLEAVGHPTAVNPDRALRKEAAVNG